MIETYFNEICIRERVHRHLRHRSREISYVVNNEAGHGHWMRNWLRRIATVIGDPVAQAHCTIREAQARGGQLLKENLSPAQRDQYEEGGYIEVVGGQTGKRYRIHLGRMMNVELLDSKGKPVATLCFMPRGRLADGDIMLAQKLALELFEADALKVANKVPTELRPLQRRHR
jgi:hypothetical protein